MVVVTTNTSARHRPLPDPLFPARKLVLLLLAGYVILSSGSEGFTYITRRLVYSAVPSKSKSRRQLMISFYTPYSSHARKKCCMHGQTLHATFMYHAVERSLG